MALKNRRSFLIKAREILNFARTRRRTHRRRGVHQPAPSRPDIVSGDRTKLETGATLLDAGRISHYRSTHVCGSCPAAQLNCAQRETAPHVPPRGFIWRQIMYLQAVRDSTTSPCQRKHSHPHARVCVTENVVVAFSTLPELRQSRVKLPKAT